MMDIKTDIPRKSRIRQFPMEIRHKGQLPQCYLCRELDHRATECQNDVVCFKCGLFGYTCDQCFKCFAVASLVMSERTALNYSTHE